MERRIKFNKGADEGDKWDSKVLDLARVTRVVAGGKRFKFRATIVVGDRQNHVGVGADKGDDVAQAIEKATRAAKKTAITVLTKNETVPHQVEAKYKSARVLIKPAAKGTGIKAGGPVRVILGLAGVKNATSKILSRTTNKLTNARAAIEALKKLKV